jgi:hypothetical protein
LPDVAALRAEAPSSKRQAQGNFQGPNFQGLVFGHSLELGAWILELQLIGDCADERRDARRRRQ